MTQIGFDYDQAHRALDEFLANGMDRWVAAADTPIEGRPQFAHRDVAAHIVSEETLEELRRKAHAYDEMIEEKDFPHLPAGYRPFLHSPNADTDRLIPWEPYADMISHALFGKPFAELAEHSNEYLKAMGVAMNCTLVATLDPDSEGTVPILMWAAGEREAESRKLWQMAYTTPVSGLYVRIDGNNPFFDQYAVITASGYKLVGGFFGREDATTFAVEIAKAIPAVDWLALKQAGMTKEIAEKIREAYRAHGRRADVTAARP